MTQFAAPLVPDLAPVTDAHSSAPSLATASGSRAPARGRHALVDPLVHLLAATVALVALRPAGVLLHPAAAGCLALVWPVALAAAGCYRTRPLADSSSGQVGRVLRAGAGVGLASWVAAALAGPVAAPGLLLPATSALVLATLAVTVGHGLLPRRATRVVVVGSPGDVAHALTELARSRRSFEVAAACLTHPPATVGVDLPVRVHVGVQDAAEVSAEHGADVMVVLPGPELTPSLVRRLEWEAERCRTALYVGTGLLDVAPHRTSTLQVGGLDVVHVRPAVSRGARRLCKSVVERVVAATALVVLLPLLLGIGVAIRRGSTGPAIFRQQRVGKNGRLFTMFKFRTMGCTAEREIDELIARNDADGVLFKLRSDPRVTPIGAFLRTYSIDEVPQLWNVVNGTMSLVGPRPALPGEVERYDTDPRRRLAVKPGLTGLWQVSGRSDLSWQDSVRLDVQYVDNWSLGLDLSIVARTAGAVLAHRGAY